MSNDKTLATAKHGGCVQLAASEGQAVLTTLVANWRRYADKHELNALEADSIGDMPATVQELETKCEVFRQVAGELDAALAARPPVGEPVAEYQYRFWNDDMPGWSSWQPISKSDYERELVEPFEGREVRALYGAPSRSVDLHKLRLLGQRIEQVGRNAAPTAQGSGNVYFRNVIDWGRELLALIDGKAVGNG